MNNTMIYKGYIGTVHYSAEDNVFYGKIHGINDLVTFEGQSISELKNAFRASINDYFKTCKILGKSPDKTYKGSFNVRLTSRLHKLAVINALKNNMTLNDFVKKAISNSITP
ncbi:MAG: type II toxin-antitoxin system HicB family antitoxin [Cytophagales bacterium]|nr:type II toxin-antitoxin system HicB family antitoxin [Cytophagales bacterium]